MNAANDTTEPTTIPAASGFDAPLWRVWRGMSAMRVVSLVIGASGIERVDPEAL